MSPRQANPRGPRFRLAIAAVIALLAYFAFAILPRLRIETNLLALLPSTAETRVQLGAVTRFADRSSRELVFLLGTADRDRLRDTGMAFAGKLTDSGNKKAVNDAVKEIGKQPHVHTVTNPLSSAGQTAGLLSKDGQTAFAPVLMDVGSGDLTEEIAGNVLDATKPAQDYRALVHFLDRDRTLLFTDDHALNPPATSWETEKAPVTAIADHPVSVVMEDWRAAKA